MDHQEVPQQRGERVNTRGETRFPLGTPGSHRALPEGHRPAADFVPNIPVVRPRWL